MTIPYAIRQALAGVNLSGAYLFAADLTRSNLTDVNLTRSNLTDANLTRSNLTDANLTRADLTGAYGRDDWADLVERGAIRQTGDDDK
jgi:uncharacterized protein YjbI with pentapeptide repeats